MGKAVKMRDSKNNYVYPCPYFPVGSIYLSVVDLDPSSYFGGTWEQIQGKFLLACNSTYTAGSTGGEATHTLTASEMPSHTHTISSGGAHTHTYTGFIQNATSSSTTWLSIAHKRYDSDGTTTPPSMNSSGAHTHTPAKTGGGQAHNNMPPFLAVYMWKRIA